MYNCVYIFPVFPVLYILGLTVTPVLAETAPLKSLLWPQYKTQQHGIFQEQSIDLSVSSCLRDYFYGKKSFQQKLLIARSANCPNSYVPFEFLSYILVVNIIFIFLLLCLGWKQKPQLINKLVHIVGERHLKIWQSGSQTASKTTSHCISL